MPSRIKRVRFETEYNSSFKAFDPDVYKSPLISALIDEPRTTDFDKTKTAAGLKSNKFLKSSEPPLQRKSKSGTAHDRTSKKIQNTNRRQNFETNKDSVENNNNLTKKNRALEYKAGLRPDYSLERTKFPISEYQREYERKKLAIGDTPLLNAEKIVFDSHTNIPRFVRVKVPHRTEYQSKFAETQHGASQKQKKENKVEHEKSEDNPPSAVKRLLQTSHNPDPPFFPHGSSNRVIHTEYQANFGSPKKFRYEEGIWLGAKPPHLLPDDQLTPESAEHINSWFQEVLELREKARHYKVRAIEGNYFSREYLAQLDSELKQLYEEESETYHSKKKKKPGHDDAILQLSSESKSSENSFPGNSAGRLGDPRVKHADESEECSGNIEDGKKVYRDLNEQFKNVSLDSEVSHSEHDSVLSGNEQSAYKNRTKQSRTISAKQSPSKRSSNKTQSKPLFTKTMRQKHLPKHTETVNPGETFKGDRPMMHDQSNQTEHRSEFGGSNPLPGKTINHKHSPTSHRAVKPLQAIRREASLLQDESQSESENSATLEKPVTKVLPSQTDHQKSLLTFHPSTKGGYANRGDGTLLRNMSSGSDASSELSEDRHGNESEDSYQSPDRFNIKYVKGMHSNDKETPSTSVRSTCGSESLDKSGYNSDSYLSQFSLASQESVARQALVHARQRKENFW